MSNPFMVAPAAADVATTLPLFREMDWDFKANTFRYDDAGNHIVVTGNEALKIWIRKALYVERYRYRAYFDDYGAELEHFIGSVPNDAVESNRLFDYIRAALLVNPYILAVTNVSYSQDKKGIYMTIDVRTVYGKESVKTEV